MGTGQYLLNLTGRPRAFFALGSRLAHAPPVLDALEIEPFPVRRLPCFSRRRN